MDVQGKTSALCVTCRQTATGQDVGTVRNVQTATGQDVGTVRNVQTATGQDVRTVRNVQTDSKTSALCTLSVAHPPVSAG